MEIKTKQRRKKSPLSIFAVAAIPVALGIGIAAFSLGGSEDLELISLLRKEDAINNNLTISLKVGEKQEENAAGVGYGSKDEWGNGETTLITTATDGTGLNLLLINNIQTESFVKEYLSICAENQNGQLDTTARSKYATVSMTIGVNISESKFYAAGGGNILPKTDLPQSADGTPKWDGAEYSLKKWGSVQHHSLGGATATGGPLQYTSGGTITAIHTKSKYNSGTSTGTGAGDCYLFPDAVCGLNDYIAGALSWIGGDSTAVSNNAASVAGVIAHNRGAGGMSMIYGIPYSEVNNSKVYINKANGPASEMSGILDIIYNDMTNVPQGTTVEYPLTRSYYYASLFPFIANGWYFSSEAGANAQAHCTNSDVAFWNQLFPNEQVADVNGLRNAIGTHTKSLAGALGISATECDRIYGTTNGEYVSYTNSYKYGEIFKVTNTTSTVYRTTGAKLVHCLEAMCAEHLYNTFATSGVVYARMLKYAGVNVDPTNPSTYMGGYADEWTPTSDVEAELIAHGLDTTKVTEQGLRIVTEAAKLLGIPYKQCRNFVGCDGNCYNNMNVRPTHLDCSSYVWRTYINAGISSAGFPTATMYYPGSVFTDVSLENAVPGDVFKSPGHVEIFLGTKDGKIYCVGAHYPGKDSSYSGVRSVSSNSGPDIHYYHYKGSN